jgi:hypothetical protein
MKRNQAAAGWPTVMGKIVGSTLETYVSYDDDGDARTMFRPLVTYEYEVEGQVYTSTQVKVTKFSGSNLERQQLKKLEAYPMGGAVKVHYDSFNPQDALLEINPAKINFGMIIGILSGIAMLYFVYQFIMSI